MAPWLRALLELIGLGVRKAIDSPPKVKLPPPISDAKWGAPRKPPRGKPS